MLNVVPPLAAVKSADGSLPEYTNCMLARFFYSVTSNDDNVFLHCFKHLSQIFSEFISKPFTEFKYS